MIDPESPSFGRVGIFLGGRSRERAISLKSGRAIHQALKEVGLDVVLIDTANGFISRIKKAPIDIAFPALHGTGGEDGTIQRILEKARIPYVGSAPKASALAFDKFRAKQAFRRFNIPTPPYELLTRKNWKRIVQKWNPPYVIKPVSEGSSIGIFFVERRGSGLAKIQLSFRKYPQLLIEKKIGGREFTVGILDEVPLPVIELKPKRKFYDFKAKYTKGLTEYLIPAPISRELSERLKAIALKAHRTLGLRDLSRVDIKVDSGGQPFVLEVNSIPGFTETSLLPKAARETGLDFTALCLKLVELAYQRKKLKDHQDAKAPNVSVERQIFASI